MNGSTYRSRSRMKEAATYDSYFGSRLAAQAAGDDVAAPATIESLSETLSTYLTPDQVEQVRAAYEYAREAHEGQFRRTGHPYITHPLAVAGILAEMRMDHPTRDGRAAARRDRRHRYREARAR